MKTRKANLKTTAGALTLWIAGIIVSQAAGESQVMQGHFSAKGQGSSMGGFIQGFPFDQYFKQVGFTDFDTVQADRLFMWKKFGDGDEFLFHLGQKFIDLHAIQPDLGHLQAKTAIGESYLRAKGQGINSRNNIPYEVIGYFLLSKVAETMSQEIANGKMNPDAPDVQKLMTRLSNNKVHVAFERSFFRKLAFNVQKGNWAYIGNRVANKVKGKVGGVTGGGAQQTQYSGTPAIQLSTFRVFAKQQKDFKMTTFNATERSNKRPLGHIVFLQRPAVGADYLAQNVQNRMNAKKRPMLAMTGGFTNNYQKPEGLTVDHGVLVNAVVMPDRDGLVLVQKNGGIRVINLDRAKIKLPDAKAGVVEVENPRTSLIAYSRLLKWCQENAATAFQTQLLAYSDTMLIDPQKASNTPAERRLLALATDTKSGAVTHVVFNIREPHALAEIADKAFHLLKNRNLKVEAILNLDTGGQDVMAVFDEKGNAVPQIKGRLGLGNTTNLLVYSY